MSQFTYQTVESQINDKAFGPSLSIAQTRSMP